jgi:hypothetical protein
MINLAKGPEIRQGATGHKGAESRTGSTGERMGGGNRRFGSVGGAATGTLQDVFLWLIAKTRQGPQFRFAGDGLFYYPGCRTSQAI